MNGLLGLGHAAPLSVGSAWLVSLGRRCSGGALLGLVRAHRWLVAVPHGGELADDTHEEQHDHEHRLGAEPTVEQRSRRRGTQRSTSANSMPRPTLRLGVDRLAGKKLHGVSGVLASWARRPRRCGELVNAYTIYRTAPSAPNRSTTGCRARPPCQSGGALPADLRVQDREQRQAEHRRADRDVADAAVGDHRVQHERARAAPVHRHRISTLRRWPWPISISRWWRWPLSAVARPWPRARAAEDREQRVEDRARRG